MSNWIQMNDDTSCLLDTDEIISISKGIYDKDNPSWFVIEVIFKNTSKVKYLVYNEKDTLRNEDFHTLQEILLNSNPDIQYNYDELETIVQGKVKTFLQCIVSYGRLYRGNSLKNIDDIFRISTEIKSIIDKHNLTFDLDVDTINNMISSISKDFNIASVDIYYMSHIFNDISSITNLINIREYLYEWSKDDNIKNNVKLAYKRYSE